MVGKLLLRGNGDLAVASSVSGRGFAEWSTGASEAPQRTRMALGYRQADSYGRLVTTAFRQMQASSNRTSKPTRCFEQWRLTA